MRRGLLFVFLGLMVGAREASEIEPAWESMAKHYRVPEWFRDGKIGVWMHWGIPSSIDENRPHDGSHYGAWMYGLEGQLSTMGRPAARKAVERLAAWHTKRYGPPSEFGYEKLIPLWKAEKWDPDALVRLFKDCGARFIMPVAVHHDNFDLYDSSFPRNSVKMGPRRDIVGEWKAAARKHGLKFGVSTHLYWELIEKSDPDMFNNDAPYPDERRGKALGLKLFAAFLDRDLRENGGRQIESISLLGSREKILWERTGEGLKIALPRQAPGPAGHRLQTLARKAMTSVRPVGKLAG